jgi:hypothetical protein
MSKAKPKLDTTKLSIWHRLKGSNNWSVCSTSIGADEEKFKQLLKGYILKGYEVKVVQIHSLASYNLHNMVDNYVDKLFDVRELAPKLPVDDFEDVWEEGEKPKPYVAPAPINPVGYEDEDDYSSILSSLSNRRRKKD